MSKESIVAGATATGILGSAIGVGISYYGKSFRLEPDNTFNFNLQTYPEKSVGRDSFDFDIFGFSGPGACVNKIVGDVQIPQDKDIKNGITYTPVSDLQQLEANEGCLIADVIYSNREEKNKKDEGKATAITAKFELAAIDKEKTNAVVVWMGLTNTTKKVDGVQVSHRVIRFTREKGDNKSWIIKDGYEFNTAASTEADIIFDKLSENGTKSLELKNACKENDTEDRKCENIETRLWKQKKGAWTWKPATDGKDITKEFSLTIKFGSKTDVFFFGKSIDGNKPTLSRIYQDKKWLGVKTGTISNTQIKSPFKSDKNKGSWTWFSCPETKPTSDEEKQWGICGT